MNWAAKANCIQRAGRAGRVANGRVYRLVNKYFYEVQLFAFILLTYLTNFGFLGSHLRGKDTGYAKMSFRCFGIINKANELRSTTT